jgi:hypothetical protein
MNKTYGKAKNRIFFGVPHQDPPTGYEFSLNQSGRLLILVNQETGCEYFACPEGDHWNLTPRHFATLWDKIRTFGRFRMGAEYADYRRLIQIPA